MRSSTCGIAAGMVVWFFFAACGKSSADLDANGGEAGEPAVTEVPDPVRCGPVTCKAITLPTGAVAPCCVNPADGICGAELNFGLPGTSSSMTCQPLTQPGKLDRACPASMGGVIGGLPLPAFPGCCRTTGQCGHLVSDLFGLLPFPPGCIDAQLLSNGEAPVACGPGAGGSGGEGAGGVSGEAGSGGNGSGEGGSGGNESSEPASGSNGGGEAGFGGNGSTQ
jgi:hypothetical protein